MQENEEQESLAIPRVYKGKSLSSQYEFYRLYREGDILVFKDRSTEENHKICDYAYKFSRRHGFHVTSKTIKNLLYIIRLDPLRHEHKTGDTVVKYNRKRY